MLIFADDVAIFLFIYLFQSSIQEELHEVARTESVIYQNEPCLIKYRHIQKDNQT